MKVKVNLISLFAKYEKSDDDGLTAMPDNGTVQDLAERLELPLKRVKIVTVNGVQGDLTTQLSENDLVYLFPPAIGGG